MALRTLTSTRFICWLFPQHSSNHEPILVLRQCPQTDSNKAALAYKESCAALQWHAMPYRMSAIMRDLIAVPHTTVTRQGLILAYSHAVLLCQNPHGRRKRRGPKTQEAVGNKCCGANEKAVAPRTLTALLGDTSYTSVSTQLAP